jgi:hypothetical protein
VTAARLAVAAIVLGACWALAGCGPEDEPAETVPVEPAETNADAAEPPPAEVVTGAGAQPLARWSYCWRLSPGEDPVCADFPPPWCGAEGIPTLEIERGERVRFRLGFDPNAVDLTFYGLGHGGEAAGQEALDAGREPEWEATTEGAFTLYARGADRGDAGYAGCIRFR